MVFAWFSLIYPRLDHRGLPALGPLLAPPSAPALYGHRLVLGPLKVAFGGLGGGINAYLTPAGG